MKKILIVTSSEGHLSLARAIQSQLQGTYEVEVFVKHAIEIEMYKPVYRFFPFLFKIPYLAAQYIPQLSRQAHKMSKYNHANTIQEKIESFQPDAVISTYFLYNYICYEYCLLRHIPCLAMMANPYSVHTIELIPSPGILLAYNEETKRLIEKISKGKDQTEITGWFVQDQFTPTRDKKLIREQLGLSPDKLTILVATGSDGSASTLKFLAAMQAIKRPTHIIFICGSNTVLEKFVRKSLAYLQQRNPLLTTTVLGFISNMHEYIQASDVVVGKAGPNTLFESVACEVPFFAITHITGQEDGNLKLIRDKKLGFVEENPFKAAKLLERIITNTSLLSSLTPSIREMAAYNRESKQRLIAVLEKVLNKDSANT